MSKFTFFLRLATALPWSWWTRLWWKVYFQKRIFFMPTGGNLNELIMAYVPYAEMSHAEAARLAVERDQQAAKELAESAETQLRMEQAAKLLAEMGHLAD